LGIVGLDDHDACQQYVAEETSTLQGSFHHTLALLTKHTNTGDFESQLSTP